MDLDEGNRKQWNRACELAAWIAMMVCYRIPQSPCAWGKSGDDPLREIRTYDSFLKKYPPPGYRPD